MNKKIERARRFSHLVALRVKAEMTGKNMTAAKLSHAIGTTPAILSNYFTGKREMPLSMLDKCCEHIGVTPALVVERAYQDLLSELKDVAEVLPMSQGVDINIDEIDFESLPHAAYPKVDLPEDHTP